MFFINPAYLRIEYYLLGIAYLANLTIIFRYPKVMQEKEITVYLIFHFLMTAVVIFLFFHDFDIYYGMASPRVEIWFDD
jgi:hypothetical protein